MTGADLGRGAVVLGMHRSGTSAVTALLDCLGLRACVPEDRFPPRRWNPRGNFESRSLVRFDDALLNKLGGSWFAPPDPPDDWAMSEELGDLVDEAAALFAAAYPFRAWAWKDPRACLLMPFWDRVLGAGMPRVLVLRNPLEIAASLGERNHIAVDKALDLAGRYIRNALVGCAGRPVLITRYDDVLQDPRAWVDAATTFLQRHGLPARLTETRLPVDAELRHHVAPPATISMTHAALDVWRWAAAQAGAHESLSLDDAPIRSRGPA